MQWTMPHRVLQIVASVIVLAAVASFAMGVITAPQRGGRLPGEKPGGSGRPATAIDATDATPLSNERIEGPPPPANDEAKTEEAASEADAGNSDEDAGASAGPAPAGDAPPVLGGPPAPDEPPH